MGQSNVWYADSPQGVDFRKEISDLNKKHVEKKKQRMPPVFRQLIKIKSD